MSDIGWPTPIYRILVTGSRKWPDDDTLLPDTLRDLYQCWPSAVLIVGFNPITHQPAGVDRRSHSTWWALGGKTECHPADWERFGRGAGKRRNQEMVDTGADLCIAFIYENSGGATDCAGRAAVSGIPVVTFRHPTIAVPSF